MKVLHLKLTVALAKTNILLINIMRKHTFGRYPAFPPPTDVNNQGHGHADVMFPSFKHHIISVQRWFLFIWNESADWRASAGPGSSDGLNHLRLSRLILQRVQQLPSFLLLGCAVVCIHHVRLSLSKGNTQVSWDPPQKPTSDRAFRSSVSELNIQ